MTLREILTLPYISIGVFLSLIYVINLKPGHTRHIDFEKWLIEFNEKVKKVFIDVILSAIIWALLIIAIFNSLTAKTLYKSGAARMQRAFLLQFLPLHNIKKQAIGLLL